MYDDNVAGSAENSSNDSARALNPGEPVEEPEARRRGKVKDRLAYFCRHLTV
jgi:hypothetical protein